MIDQRIDASCPGDMITEETKASETGNGFKGPEPVEESAEHYSDASCPAGEPRKSALRLLRLLLGRLILRACPSGSEVNVCEGCHLRALCKCAHEDFRAAATVERRFWAIMAFSAGLVLVYALISFLRAA